MQDTVEVEIRVIIIQQVGTTLILIIRIGMQNLFVEIKHAFLHFIMHHHHAGLHSMFT